MEIKKNKWYGIGDILEHELLGKRYLIRETVRRLLRDDTTLDARRWPYGKKDIWKVYGEHIINWRKKSGLYIN